MSVLVITLHLLATGCRLSHGHLYYRPRSSPGPVPFPDFLPYFGV